MGKLRAFYRLLIFVVHTGWLVLQFWIGSFSTKDPYSLTLRLRRKWMSRVPRLMGVRTSISGTVPEAPVMFMANHRSYLDPVLFLRLVDAMPISKAEVRKWPLIGYAAYACGTLFVRRTDRQSRTAVLGEMEKALLLGRSLLNFPEGTTSSKQQILPLLIGGFQLAERLQIPVVPVAIEYEREEDAWIDDDGFVRHFFQFFGRRKLFTAIRFGPALMEMESIALRDATKSWIDSQLPEMRSILAEMNSKG